MVGAELEDFGPAGCFDYDGVLGRGDGRHFARLDGEEA